MNDDNNPVDDVKGSYEAAKTSAVKAVESVRLANKFWTDSTSKILGPAATLIFSSVHKVTSWFTGPSDREYEEAGPPPPPTDLDV